MERREGAQTPYEVYCPNCRVTFAAETRHCIHCGQRLGRPGRPAAVAAGSPRPTELEAEIEETNPLRRAGGISLWVLIAIGAALARMCSGE